MFEFFPGNYVWNLSTNLACCMGANIGELEEACRPAVHASARGDDAGTEAFFAAWCAVAERLVGLAEDDVRAGRHLSAGEKYGRACVYYMTAERMQRHAFAPRHAAYSRMLECLRKSVALRRESCIRVEIPYARSSFPGLFIGAAAPASPRAPCMVFVNGLDSVKEMVYRAGIARALRERGVSTLIVDQPGVGEALRLRGLTAVADTERWASPAFDVMAAREDVDPDRIGIMGWSLGGYYAPRAAAFDPRFSLCVAWGANYDWGEVQRRRLAREGDRPVPHYWEHVQWVWGKTSLDEFMQFVSGVTLAGTLHRIEVPFLITHGENDRQIPLEYARRTYAEAVSSRKRELKIFTAREGGVEHVSADNMAGCRDFIADWIAETFREQS